MRVILFFSLLVFIGIKASWGQTNLVGFSFENTLAPTIDNVSGVPAFISNGVLNLAYSTGTPCELANMYIGDNWTTNDNHRVTFDGTGFQDFVLTYCDRTSNVAISNFKVRVSTDLATWTDVVVTYVPSTSNTSRTSITFPATCNNSSTIYVEFFKVNAAGSTGNVYRIDNILITGVNSCSAPTATLGTTTSTVCANTVTSFTVGTNATSPTYTWEASANGTTGWATVANSTPANTTYTAINSNSLSLTTGTTGIVYYYRAKVTEGGTCTATSNVYTLTTVASPTVSAPASRTVCSANTTSFVVTSSTGSTQQWQYSTDGTTFTNVPVDATHTAVTTNTLPIVAPSTTLTGYIYRCVVSNAYCASVNSSTAMLTVNLSPPTPPTPTALANPACVSTSLTAMTSTVAGVTWYWQGTSSTSTTTTNSTITNFAVNTSGTYYVRAINSTSTCASAASSLSVTIGTSVTLTGLAQNKTLCFGSNTTFTSSGSGTSTKYWQYSSDGISYTVVPVDGVHTGTNLATLSLASPPVSLNGYQYQMVVNEPGCPIVTSATSTLNVFAFPATPPTPTAIANPACSSTSLIAMTSTVAGVTWYWQTTAGGTSTLSPTSASYPISATSTVYVKARANGAACFSASSSSIAVTINNPPTIASHPANTNACNGANTNFSVTASGTSLTYVWQVDDNLGGGFVNITGAPYSNFATPTLSITGVTLAMDGYKYRCIVNGVTPCPSATTTAGTLLITSTSTPTVPSSLASVNNIGCNGYNITWTNGNGSNRLVVVSTSPITGVPVNGTAYTANFKYGLGSTIATGEYVVYNGTSNSVYVTGLSASTTYYYKIFDFTNCANNYLTSGTIPNGNSTTGSCSSPAGIVSVYIDACAGGCGFEGNNELIWGITGSYGMNVTSSTGPVLHFNSTSPPATIKINSYSPNAGNLAILNSGVTSCTNTVFVDPTIQGFIPPNSSFLIANQCLCSPTAYDFSGLCNSGPIYVVFGRGPNPADWPCNSGGGIFGNNSACNGSPRYFDLDMNNWGIPLAPIYNYDPCLLTAGDDGDVTNYDVTGGATTGYSNLGCIVPPSVLPIELLDFYGTKTSTGNELTWKVAMEENIESYIIEKSRDGIEFSNLLYVNPLSNSTEIKTYKAIDENPFNEITYYRLGTKESNGSVYKHKTIAVDFKNNDWNFVSFQTDNSLTVEFKNAVPKNSSVSIIDITGKEMATKQITESSVSFDKNTFVNGLYFVRVSTPYKTQNFKVVISN